MQLDYTFERQIMLEKEDSREEGRIENLTTLICKKLRKNKKIEEIADDLEEEVEAIEPICRLAEQFAPEYDEQQVVECFLATRTAR